MARTGIALVTARNGPSWQAVRIRAMRPAGNWVKQAEDQLTLRQKQEAWHSLNFLQMAYAGEGAIYAAVNGVVSLVRNIGAMSSVKPG